MSQNFIGADFKTIGKAFVYVTDDRAYAKAQRDEWEATTNDKYEIASVKLLIVRKKVP